MSIDYSKIPSPCYVVEEKLLRRNLEKISYVAKEAGVNIILAFKGFAMWKAFPIVREYVKNATASSLNEARLAFEEMKSYAHTYAPAYTPAEFPEIARYSSHITFNSLSQYNRFLPEIQKMDRKVSLGLRVNPEYSEAIAEIYNPCAIGTRLGVLASDLKELPEEIEGLHFHTLCEASSYSLEKTIEAFEERFARFMPQLKWVNMGGGHLITRKDYDTEHLISVLKRFKEKHKVEVILEPGSAFAWQTGVLVSSVIDITKNQHIETAVLDISFAAHTPDCLEMPYKPTILDATDEIAGKSTYRMGGNSCLAGDYIGNWSFDKPLSVGDRIVFDDMIHYTMVKTTMFNGVQHPSIGMWTQDNEFVLFKKFGYEDYKSKLS